MWCLYTRGNFGDESKYVPLPIYFWQNMPEEDKIRPTQQLGPNWADTQLYFSEITHSGWTLAICCFQSNQQGMKCTMKVC